MDKQNIVSINGRSYDAATGMPLSSDKPKKSEKPKQRGTASVHRPPERSKTLNRRLAKKHSPSTAKRPSTGRTMDIAKGSRFTKFAPSAVTALAKPHEATTPDKPASSHPVAARALK